MYAANVAPISHQHVNSFGKYRHANMDQSYAPTMPNNAAASDIIGIKIPLVKPLETQQIAFRSAAPANGIFIPFTPSASPNSGTSTTPSNATHNGDGTMTDANGNIVVVDQRHILAERFKTKECRNYLQTGVCPYESRCMFAHGPDDLRTAAMNIRDGLFTEDAIKAFKRAQRNAAREERDLAYAAAAAAAAASSHTSTMPPPPSYGEATASANTSSPHCNCGCGCDNCGCTFAQFQRQEEVEEAPLPYYHQNQSAQYHEENELVEADLHDHDEEERAASLTYNAYDHTYNCSDSNNDLVNDADCHHGDNGDDDEFYSTEEGAEEQLFYHQQPQSQQQLYRHNPYSLSEVCVPVKVKADPALINVAYHAMP